MCRTRRPSKAITCNWTRGQCHFNPCTLAPLLRRRHPLSSRLCVTSINPGGSGTLCTRRGPGMGERSVGLRLWGLTSVELKKVRFFLVYFEIKSTLANSNGKCSRTQLDLIFICRSRRNAAGFSPYSRLNHLLKCGRSAKPHSRAISVALLLVLSSIQ